MDENFNLMESNISTLIENVNNSNINNDIEIIKVNIGKINTTKDVKVLKISSVSKYLRTNIPEKDIYKDSKDLRGNKRINRIELYPDLDNDIFVPIYYPIKNKEVSDEYRINKNGEIINIKTKQLLLGTITKRNYCQVVLINKNNDKICYLKHRLVSFTNLFNPDPRIYKVPNHINSNTLDNTLSNLEWLSISDNNTSEKQVPRKCKKNGLEETSKLIGYSENLSITWLKHWKYDNIWVCKEGFISDGKRRIGCINKEGYIKVYIQSTKEYLFAHRVIMEYKLHRDLKPGEIVDHIDTNRSNNSFDNLRITNLKGNMNNPNTLNKYYKRIVLANLFGDFVSYDHSDNLKKIIYKNYTLHNVKPNSSHISINHLTSSVILGANYFCIETGDKDSLYKKMENVVYVFNSDKTKVVGAYSSTVTASEHSGLYRDTISRKLKNGTIAKDNYYYMRGPEAVKLVLALGHGTAANFKPEETK